MKLKAINERKLSGKKSLIKKGILAEITKIMNTLKQTLKRKFLMSICIRDFAMKSRTIKQHMDENIKIAIVQ